MVVLFIASCKKEEKPEPVEFNDTEEAFLTKDDNFFQKFAESEFSEKDINARAILDVCGAVIDRNLFLTKQEISVTFDGRIKCYDGVSRSGRVILTLTMGESWEDKNAEISLNFVNYSVSQECCDGLERKITFSGIKKIQNLSGGLTTKMLEGDSIVHLVRSFEFLIKLEGEPYTAAVWNSKRKRTITKSNEGLEVMVIGRGDADGKSNLADWGTDKFGEAFYTSFLEPKINKTCNERLKIISGVKSKEGSKSITYYYGSDAAGNIVNDCNSTGIKMVWFNDEGQLITTYCPYE